MTWKLEMYEQSQATSWFFYGYLFQNSRNLHVYTPPYLCFQPCPTRFLYDQLVLHPKHGHLNAPVCLLAVCSPTFRKSVEQSSCRHQACTCILSMEEVSLNRIHQKWRSLQAQPWSREQSAVQIVEQPSTTKKKHKQEHNTAQRSHMDSTVNNFERILRHNSL